jgi:hypothetical protein
MGSWVREQAMNVIQNSISSVLDLQHPVQQEEEESKSIPLSVTVLELLFILIVS